MPGAFGAGGTIVLAYTDGQERWELRLPVAPFDPASFLYTGAGVYVPTETGLVETLAALGSLWAPYFDPSWALSLEAVFHQSGPTGTKLTSLPTVGTIQGTSGAASSANPPIKRGFTFVSALGNRQRVRLFSVATNQVGAARVCTASTGGFDGRDQQLVAYLCSGQSGAVCWDGQPFPPSARVYQKLKLSPFESAVAGGGITIGLSDFPYGVTGDLLVNIGGVWVRLPAGALGQRLTMDLHGSAALPTWLDDCCADTHKVITPLPAAGNPCDADATTRRCGAAVQMAEYLALYYSKVRSLLNAAAGGVVVIGLPVLADLLLGAAPTLTTMGGLLSVRQVLRLLTGLALRGLNVSVAPVLSSAMQAAIRQAIYCALPVCPAPLEVTDDVRAHWCAALTANPVFTELAGPILALLSEIVSLAGWQTLANLGAMAPQTTCTTCGAGAAMQGGAQFGVGLTRAMQGGAEFGVRLSRAMQGGAQFGASLTGAMQGGAKRV